MRTVQVGNNQVTYDIDGKGPGLVLLHGTGGSSEVNWSHLVSKFTDRWTVVRPNLSTISNAQDTKQGLDITDLAEQVVGAARHAGLTTFDIVGFSFGATVAAVAAAENPGVINRLVLLGGFLSSQESRQKLQFHLWKELAHKDPLTLCRLFILTGFSPEYLSQFSEADLEVIVETFYNQVDWKGINLQLELALNVDISPFVDRIKQQSLVIGFTQDHIIPISNTKALSCSLPNGKFIELDTGHFGKFEQPDKIINTISQFLLENNS